VLRAVFLLTLVATFGGRALARDDVDGHALPDADVGSSSLQTPSPDAGAAPELDAAPPPLAPVAPAAPPPLVPVAPAAPPPTPSPPASESPEGHSEGSVEENESSKSDSKGHTKKSAASDEDEEEYQELAPRPNAKGDAFGDEPENGPKTKGFAFRLLLQTRYTRVFDDASVKDAETNDGFALNRAFLRGVVHPYKWLSAKLLVDFAEFAYSNPQQALKLAYGEIKPVKRLELTFGLFKRTYSLLELLPIAEYELADTGPTDNLIKDTQFGGRDAGLMVRGNPLPKRRWLHIYLGAFGGAGEGAEGIPGTTGNVNTGPDLAAPSLLLTARLMSRPLKHLSLGADGAWRPNGTPAVSLPPQSQVTSGKATSADATYSNEFLELRGEWLWGDRTDISYRGDARTFMAAWGIFAVRFPVAHVLAMPTVRFEWLDADRQQSGGQRYLVSGALNLDFTAHVRLLLDLSRDQLSSGLPPNTTPPGVFTQSSTVFVTQIQLKV
jgi:hypothetical protein